MSKVDLILLHAPSIYDFRKREIIYGPISDAIPSTPIFDMYPIGFMTLAGKLMQEGLSVRIINIAVKMLRSKHFNVEKYISSLEPLCFGIDLHWLAHTQGSLELASIVKKYHPNIPVIFGGLSASYYHKELISYPQVDYVVRGDSTEEPLMLLIKAIKSGGSLYEVPNLTWKDSCEQVRARGVVSARAKSSVFPSDLSEVGVGGSRKIPMESSGFLSEEGVPAIHINELTYIPDTLDHLIFDYRTVIKCVLNNWDLVGHLPFKNWLKYPITAVLPMRGCVRDCAVCGGSASSFRRLGRKRPAFRSPELLAKDIQNISTFSDAPIMVLGDVQECCSEAEILERSGNPDPAGPLRRDGNGYLGRFVDAFNHKSINNHLAFEIFAPWLREAITSMLRVSPNLNLQISPESHNEEVRQVFGKNYSNTELETGIETALELGVKRIDVFFMVGLPKQTPKSVMGTVEYCEYLLKIYGKSKRLHPFIAPLSPFLDPGGKIFESPEQYWYKLFCKTLEDHRKSMLMPSWKDMLNYETKWMNKDEIATTTYEACLRLNRIKEKYGLIEPKIAQRIEKNIYSDLTNLTNPTSLTEGITCKKDEMDWPKNKGLKRAKIMWEFVRGRI
ncbi:MAG: cobalamin B12-binding domain-containing protein [Candidatus Stahlbacteria bacterium]|nr:cobalamin B12-binding domain-containing protein [Candidatus Stahlbacteria bacterium]